MPDNPILPQSRPEAADILRQIAESQSSMALNLRALGRIFGLDEPTPREAFRSHLISPTPIDDVREGIDCEICGSPVPAHERSGFALRHGSTIHADCLSAQIEASR